MRIKIAVILALAIVTVVISVNMHSGSVVDIASTISDKLRSEGFNLDLQVFNQEFSATIVSTTAQQRAEPDDMLALRRVRNEARSYITKNRSNSKPDVITEVIVNARGEVIYEASINDAFVVPQDVTNSALFNSRVDMNDNDVMNILDSLFQSENLNVVIPSISQSMLGGKFVELELMNHSNNYDYINEQIPKIQALVESVNEKGAKIVEYTLTVKSENNGEILLLLSVDLMYRDFLWWQSLEFGNQTWTKSSPATTVYDEPNEVNETIDNSLNNTTKTPVEAANGY